MESNELLAASRDAALTIARRVGLEVREQGLLRSTNNVLLWLQPAGVVAKVGTNLNQLRLEVEAARFAEERGAPVVGPMAVRAGPHQEGDFAVSFWPYHEQAERLLLDPGSVAQALHELHQVLGSFPEEVPNFDSPARQLRSFLAEPNFTPALGDDERQLLLSGIDWALEQLRQTDGLGRWRLLHGAPHFNNWLVVESHPRLIDFESVCRGPLEWDLAVVTDEVRSAYPASYDGNALRVCRLLASATTSGWCWAGLDRGPDMRRHAEHHLEVVKAWSDAGRY